MRTMFSLSGFFLSGLAFVAGPALAQKVPTTPMPIEGMGRMGGAPAVCPTTPAAFPPELAHWSEAVPIKAAIVPADVPAATIAIGRGTNAMLSPVGTMMYPVLPGRHGEADTNGGLLNFDIKQAGTYRVALGASVWIDVVRDGHPVASIAHGHGPACSPIRKTVDFTLLQGRYLLQLSGAKTATLSLMIVAAPLQG